MCREKTAHHDQNPPVKNCGGPIVVLNCFSTSGSGCTAVIDNKTKQNKKTCFCVIMKKNVITLDYHFMQKSR